MRALLRDFSNPAESTRPRVIFLITHQCAFLDLLEAWLSADPYLSSLALYRLPIDHLDHSRESASAPWVDLINSWPVGTKGPLVVLMHARSPALGLLA